MQPTRGTPPTTINSFIIQNVLLHLIYIFNLKQIHFSPLQKQFVIRTVKMSAVHVNRMNIWPIHGSRQKQLNGLFNERIYWLIYYIKTRNERHVLRILRHTIYRIRALFKMHSTFWRFFFDFHEWDITNFSWSWSYSLKFYLKIFYSEIKGKKPYLSEWNKIWFISFYCIFNYEFANSQEVIRIHNVYLEVYIIIKNHKQ